MLCGCDSKTILSSSFFFGGGGVLSHAFLNHAKYIFSSFAQLQVIKCVFYKKISNIFNISQTHQSTEKELLFQ